jgi:hypothetical protein
MYSSRSQPIILLKFSCEKKNCKTETEVDSYGLDLNIFFNSYISYFAPNYEWYDGHEWWIMKQVEEGSHRLC